MRRAHAVAAMVFAGFTFACGVGVGVSAWLSSDYFRAVVWYFINRWG